MSAHPSKGNDTLAIAEQVDALCDRYEAAWRRGEKPNLDAWLPADGPLRKAALVELVRVELEQRRQAGEAATLEEYLHRYPELSDHAAALAPLHEAPTMQPAADPDATRSPDPAPNGGAAPAAPVVPGYEILGELGRGGMGVVYKARHIKLNRVVALKMILGGGHAGEADLARFRTEAEAVARLQHPNIVQIFEVGDCGGLPYFSLEFCAGGSLDRKLAGTPLPPKEASGLIETLARAIHAAHQQKVIHRDLKPANVLLTEDGTPKITDFGLAKKLDAAGATQSGAVMGTPSYMAPEQAGGKAKEMGPACDVYALGAILYECLTGRPPFKAATPLDTILQVVADEPAPPRRLQGQTPRDLEAVCLKCLRKEPGKRYAGANALADDLHRFLRGEPTRARPVRWPERLGRRMRRHAVVLSLTAAIFVLGTGLLLLLGLRWLHPSGEPPRAQPPAVPPSAVEPVADDLPQTIADLDRQDPGWRLDQIDNARKRRPLPDEQNSAVRTQAVKRLLSAGWPDTPTQQVLDAIESLPPTARLAEPQAAALRLVLQQTAPALQEAHKLAGMGEGRYTIDWQRDALSTLIPHAQDCRLVAALLFLDAAASAQDGNAQQAMASCRGVLAAGRSLGDEPITTSQLVRLACDAQAVQGLERVLALTEPADADLAAAQELLENEASHPMFLISARAERGGLHWIMTGVEAGDFPLAGILVNYVPEAGGSFQSKDPAKPEVHPAPDLPSLRRAHAWLLRYSTRLVEIARLPPYQELREVERWEANIADAPWEARSLLVAGRKVVGASLRLQAQLRTATAAVAAERYRQAHGRWPDALADLVPALLREIPADPYDGAPLRYRRLDDSVVIYAIGPDGKDDGGVLDPKNMDRPDADVGFRLWDASRRGQAP